jgi:biopolymer transport protein ExbD
MHAQIYQNEQNRPAPVAEINTTPLVDVMLVLLIIFMITAPQFQGLTAVKIPPVGPTPILEKPSKVLLSVESVDGALQMRLDGDLLSLGELALQARKDSQHAKPPSYQLRIDPNVNYSDVPNLIATIRRNGIADIRFDELAPR